MDMSRRLAVKVLAALAVPRLAGAAAAPLRMAILPYLPAQDLHRRFSGLLGWLGRRIGTEVELFVAPDYTTMIEMVGRDQVDLAYMGPAPFVQMAARFGGKHLLGRLEVRGMATFRGIIVAKAADPVNTLADLRGRRFAFGDRQSTMSHLLPHHMLLQAGLRLGDLAGHEFLGSHNNVALGVLSGEFDAGAVKDEVFESYRVRGLKAVATTVPVSEQVFLATNRLPADLRQRAAAALAAAWADPEGRAGLSAITAGVTGLVPVASSDFDELRVILDSLAAAGDER
ncbi:Phosphonate ABC transporter, periplasmic phosphonate-binding protein [Magnetospirillum sp. UT-4]|nr:Phosphonate ABC transporter, periplasmic phosphonate-binding protein [Magnetospirillum sp. UT-4]